MNAFLVTGGFVDDKFTLDYIKRENYQVAFAVDRGLEFFYRTGLVPDHIVGDFDSIDENVLKSYENAGMESGHGEEQLMRAESEGASRIIQLNPMKDDTDTEHALRMALDMGCDSIHIFGATGTRLDHVFGNLQLLGLALRQQAECMMIDPHNRIRLINRETLLTKKEQFGKYVSLIPYTPRVTGLTLEGFLYPLSNHIMSSFYLEDAAPISGISNEILEETARITMKEGILMLLESRD